MKDNKVSINIVFNILNQIVSLAVPLVLSPYVARVLTPELIGDYSFALANSTYFVLIEALGFSLYGMLRVSERRDDKKYISTLFREIMLAKVLLMMICIIAYVITFLFFIKTNTLLCAIMIFNIVATGIDTTWFLNGMEDFKTTTIRNIVVRIVNVLLIVCFVKSTNDFILYALIMQLSNFISFVAIIPTIKKYIEPAKISMHNLIQHTKKSFVYFVPGLINTIFSSADKTILGSLASNYEVGIYEQAAKICSLCGTVINSISNVLLPRITYLNHNASKEESRRFLFKTLRWASVFSIAVTVGVVGIADEFVPVFFGRGYEKSSIILKILSINVLTSVIANYIGQQCLIANSMQHKYNISISVGAVINVVLNILLVGRFQSEGVSYSSVIAGVFLFGFVVYFSRDQIMFKDLLKMSWKAIISAITMIISIYYIYIYNDMVTVVIKIIVGSIVYFVVLMILKEEILLDVFRRLKNR